MMLENGLSKSVRLEWGDTKMSVSILEVLENAGYDIKNNPDDATWLLAQRNEWEELVEVAEGLGELKEEYEDFIDLQEELGNFNNPTFEEWRKERE